MVGYILMAAFGLGCAWALMKAMNWLPIILVLLVAGVRAEANVILAYSVNNNSGGAVSFALKELYQGSYYATSMGSSSLAAGGSWGPWNSPTCLSGGGYPNGATYELFYQTPPGTGPQISAGQHTTPANACSGTDTYTWNVGGTPPPNYTWSGCVTNTTPMPQQVCWYDTLGHVSCQNIGPGQYYCVSATNNTTPFSAGFGQTGFNPDGTTNLASFPGYTAAQTNSGSANNTVSTGSPGGGPGSGMNPGGGTGAGSNTNLTGNQFASGISNQLSTEIAGFQYLGNMLSAGNSSQAAGNQQLTNLNAIEQQALNYQTQQVQILSNATNLLRDLDTNLASFPGFETSNTLSSAQSLKGMSNTLQTMSVQSSNTAASLSNLVVQGNYAGSYSSGGTNAQGTNTLTNVLANATIMANGVSNAIAAWGNGFDPQGNLDITNLTGGVANNSLWFLPMNTNIFGAAYLGGPGRTPQTNPGVDLDPRHNAMFIGVSAWARNLEVWLIALLVFAEVRSMMSKRMIAIMFTPSATHDALSDGYELPLKLAILVPLMVSLPITMAAIAYNFSNWPGHIVPAAPFSSAAVNSLAGSTWGPMVADAIDIVGYLFPLDFALGSIIYLGAVWTGLDAITAWFMVRLRYLS